MYFLQNRNNMKTIYLPFTFLLFSTISFAQFQKNEKMIGGNLDIFIIREKNSSASTSSVFGNTPAKETGISFRPEFSFIISKNIGLSLFGEILSLKNSNVPSVSETKSKSYSLGIGVSKYKFLTKEFGGFVKFRVSYAPSWSKYSDNSSTAYPKNKNYLTNISLLPGLFYRFNKHFLLQGTIGKISYDHLLQKTEYLPDSKIHNQFSVSFSDIAFGAFYIFK